MEYAILEKGTFAVLGICRTTPQAGGTWAVMKAGETAKQLEQISGHPCNLGLCFGFDQDGNNDYMCGAEYQGEPIEGFDLYRCPASAWLVFSAKGSISADVLGQVWRLIHEEFMPKSEYTQQDLPAVERYLEWNEALDTCHVEILIPVKRKKSAPVSAL